MDESVSWEVGRRRLALRHLLVLTLAALLPLLLGHAFDSPQATGIAAVALVLCALVALGASYAHAALLTVVNRRMTLYRRRDGVVVETNDPPHHPVRPRAPGPA